MKRESEGIKTAWIPAFTPGIDNGKTIRRNVCQEVAPRSLLAFNNEGLISINAL